MGTFLAIARTGLGAVLLHPLRSAATLLCLVAILLPYTAGTAIARGLLDQAEGSVDQGADLYVSGSRFGRPAPVPLQAVETLRAIPGVRDVFPRIVGEIAIGRERLDAIVVGLPADRLPKSTRCVEGRLFRGGASHELVLGAELAHRLGLKTGDLVPPFYANRQGEHVSTVVGLFRADLPIWEANLLFCSLETAQELFDQPGLATSLLVECAPDHQRPVKSAILRLPPLSEDKDGVVQAAVTSRDDLRAWLPRNLGHLAGIFQLHFVLAFAVGVPLLMVTSGLGLTERRREAALLKATGWMTDELLLRGAVESLVLSLIGASLAILLAWVWLVPLNGKGIAGVFLQAAERSPTFQVPFRLLPIPALLAFVTSFAVVATGTLYSTWRAATAPAAMALR